jgi:hypothetical protein
MNPEELRLAEESKREKDWKRWGPYLSERQWATVREDYSADGDCWNYFPHDHARSRAYRWGEDGLLGICDRQSRLCFALALWNGQDHILKERLFGLGTHEGNHGEDVKECYFYVDSTPTHSYMKALYKYPQRAFPYQHLVDENKRRTRMDPEFELIDTGIFQEGRYFDIEIEYAKAAPDDILIRIRATNRGPEAAPLHILPTLWFRNLWTWGRTSEGYSRKPSIAKASAGDALVCEHETLGKFSFQAITRPAEWIFTENETNFARLFPGDPAGADAGFYTKDAFHRYLIDRETKAVNPAETGTKAAAVYPLHLAPGETAQIDLRLNSAGQAAIDFETTLSQRIRESDEFHGPASHPIARVAIGNLMWSKQFYNYGVLEWLQGDPVYPPPPAARWKGRNYGWLHLYNRDIVSMPDNWEFPWYASWDLAFHTVAFANFDPYFAKDQLLLFLREWYMHPSGQIPAYEFEFGDVNPPVHAWAVWRVYKISAPAGKRDRVFLARAFQKLLINFTWWANRKDVEGTQIFSGGFLGLDNIGVFDRSKPIAGGVLEQADGSSWMAFYCLTMLAMALELAQEDPAYEDLASKFFEHFIAIADAINSFGGTGLWDEEDGFYYDQLRASDVTTPMKVRSMVGLFPLIAVEVLHQDAIDKLPGFKNRLEWFLTNRGDLYHQISMMESRADNGSQHRLLGIPTKARLKRVLSRMLDENEFLSPFGIRSLSICHRDHPYVLRLDGQEWRIQYEPGESQTALFGGNSNWRGPIWFPANYLLMESLERYHHFYGDDFKVECPTGSGKLMTLQEAAREINRRLCAIFAPEGANHTDNPTGKAPWQGDATIFSDDPSWRGLTWFHEYFHADTGRGCGASHQTGWTALIARCLRDQVEHSAGLSVSPDSKTSKAPTPPQG